MAKKKTRAEKSEENKRKYREQKLKKAKENTYSYLDVIVSSGEIRRQFFTRCKELKIDPHRIALAAGVSPSAFKKNYVDTAEPMAKKSFDQQMMIKMLALVGLDIRILVIPKPFSETYVRLTEKGIIKNDE